jgi:long-chain acyl-CoA synthetase
LPHYRRLRRFHLLEEGFSVENGLLTANQKLRRHMIERRYRQIIEGLYQ